jgi:acyl carrier protein
MSDVAVLNKDKLQTEIKNFIIDNFLFGDQNHEIGLDDSFMETGIIDSTGILELIEFVEESYEIKVNDNELVPENLDSLSNISTFIINKKNS